MTVKRRRETIATVKTELFKHANAQKAAFFPRFFKAGPGEYAEGDIFIGVTVPEQRKIALGFRDLPRNEIERLLEDPFHECRLTGLLILVSQFERAATERDRKSIYEFYLRHIDCVNNWDLVDTSAPKIAGPFLWQKSHQPLLKLARVKHLWKNRIAIVATLYFIKQGHFETTLVLAELLMNHSHDLIHKGVGWMLREVGDHNRKRLVDFLEQHFRKMPRTMLRYAIEKLPEPQRQSFLRR